MSLPISLPITVARDGADADCPSGPLLTLREVLHAKGERLSKLWEREVCRCQKTTGVPYSQLLPALPAVYVGLATVAAATWWFLYDAEGPQVTFTTSW